MHELFFGYRLAPIGRYVLRRVPRQDVPFAQPGIGVCNKDSVSVKTLTRALSNPSIKWLIGAST